MTAPLSSGPVRGRRALEPALLRHTAGSGMPVLSRGTDRAARGRHGARIGAGSRVGAAAAVDFEVPPCSVVAGNPARGVRRAGRAAS